MVLATNVCNRFRLTKWITTSEIYTCLLQQIYSHACRFAALLRSTNAGIFLLRGLQRLRTRIIHSGDNHQHIDLSFNKAEAVRMIIGDGPWVRSNPNRVKLLRPARVAYGHPDLSTTDDYLVDFGLTEVERHLKPQETIYYRGYGVQPVLYVAVKTQKPEFLGVYFEADSMDELVKASKIPGAGAVEDLKHPGGGKVVDIIDPSGIPFHVIYGMKKRDFTPRFNEVQPPNYPATEDSDVAAKPRRGVFHRLTSGIIPVHKLGHTGYVTNNVDELVDFYCTHFNFKPSDIAVLPDQTSAMVFMHVDLGKEYSDHHSFFVAKQMGPQPIGAHHSAFEVESIDVNMLGHEYLTMKGYNSFWGVGRNVEGSQVFDYWFDLDGFLVEHYADGDLVNEDLPVSIIPQRERNNNWGPEMKLGPPPGGAPPVGADGPPPGAIPHVPATLIKA